MKTTWLAGAVALGLALAGCAERKMPEASLYDRLGGKPAIEAVVDQFVQNVAADDRINGFFASADIPGLKILGPEPERKGGIVTFVMEGIHPDDISKALDVQGIAVRAGHHCAMPLHDRLGITASTRASFYIYNTPAEVARLATGLRETARIFSR